MCAGPAALKLSSMNTSGQKSLSLSSIPYECLEALVLNSVTHLFIPSVKT